MSNKVESVAQQKKRLKKRKHRDKVRNIGTKKSVPIHNPFGLLHTVYVNIKEVYGPRYADVFMSNPEFKNYASYSDDLQRALANRVLINKLLVFRGKNSVPVTNVIYCLIPDGDNDTWMKAFKQIVLPFLVSNKVKL